jgi:tetratricopeptide (TPR) repeat protein
MTRRLAATLRASPVTLPGLAAVVVFVVWSTDQGGYPLTHWAPGALIVLALLALTLASVPLRIAEIPIAVRIAVLCLAGYTALSFLSISWAGSPGDAWEGADRTLLYLLVFVLFAVWPQRGASALLLLGSWTLAMIGVAAYVVLHLRVGNLASLLPGGRLSYPTGYANANAAQWLMAFWPALLLARSERVPWFLRGVLAGGAVLLAEVALLSQSRGSLYATPVLLVLVFGLLPGRIRTFSLLVPVAGAVAAAIPALLHLDDRIQNGGDTQAALHHAGVAILISTLAAALVVALGALLERRLKPSQATATRTRRAVGSVAVLALVVVLAGGWVAAGNPVTRVRHGWETFKAGYGADSATGSRLVSGLGSNRYDFYRVALDEFALHPLTGIGADNFAQQYLLHGHSNETPRYPHSVELRTLAQTGLLGALLALVGLGAALVAGARAIRAPDASRRLVSAAALAGFAYWAVHGSFDWFWEFAGLGAPAFAFLGLGCALAPRRAAEQARAARAEQARVGRPPPVGTPPPAGLSRPVGPPLRVGLPLRIRGRPRGVRLLALATAGLAILVACVSLAAPWLSQLQVESAARIWTRSPARAYSRLTDAARLDPFGDGPYLVAGSIALRLGELGRADHEFELALTRVPRGAYAMLERGAIASTRGEAARALRLLERAAALDPRDVLTRQALALARAHKRVDVNNLNRSILANAQQIS